jgi:hypothetical protein
MDCDDFDLCEECEVKLNHPHNMIKIKKPLPKNDHYICKEVTI